MTLSEAYEALLKLPQIKGYTHKKGVCQEDGKPLNSCNSVSEPVQNLSSMSWLDYIAAFAADH